MTRGVILRARAERDIRATFDWYESKRFALGGEFLAELRRKLKLLREHPVVSEVVQERKAGSYIQVSVWNLLHC